MLTEKASRSPVPSADTIAFLDLFPEPGPLPEDQLQLGAIYFGHGGNVAPVAKLTAISDIGRYAFTGYEVRPYSARELTEVVSAKIEDPLVQRRQARFWPTQLLAPPIDDGSGTSLIDELTRAHLNYLQDRIKQIESKGHKLKGSRVYKEEIEGLENQISLIHQIKTY